MASPLGAFARLRNCWQRVYGAAHDGLLGDFLAFVAQQRREFRAVHASGANVGWFKRAVVYSLYVDLFNGSFEGLRERLPYLRDLGVTCLWLLPILDSPMLDAGYDVRDFRAVRAELFANGAQRSAADIAAAFRAFLLDAHAHGLRVVFDVPVNHVSSQHAWFRGALRAPRAPESAAPAPESVVAPSETAAAAVRAVNDADDDETIARRLLPLAAQTPDTGAFDDATLRSFFFWSATGAEYAQARIMFAGICESNWEPRPDGVPERYLHRFFAHQPDLNYHNPLVLLEMSKVLVHWMLAGVDGFRLDAIPFIWKDDDTDCENRPLVHPIVQFWRALVDAISPEVLLLAEACQDQVLQFFGDGTSECHAAFHFPLMPRIFQALAYETRAPIDETLRESVTPAIPATCQWFTFLRLHDEMTLEMLPQPERRQLYEFYCREPRWDFRDGIGVSARLIDLVETPRKVLLAYSMMLTLIGTPVLLYGDELGKPNDDAFYDEFSAATHIPDTRYRNRGRMEWARFDESLAAYAAAHGGNADALDFAAAPASASAATVPAFLHRHIRHMLHARHALHCFETGALVRLAATTHTADAAFTAQPQHVLVACRVGAAAASPVALVVHNVSSRAALVHSAVLGAALAATAAGDADLLGQPLRTRQIDGVGTHLELAPHAFAWLTVPRGVAVPGADALSVEA